eukprot:scaffold4779_cov116-Isochrysis_galbana.AAC.21
MPSSPSLSAVKVAAKDRPHRRHVQPTDSEGSSPGSCRRISVRSAARSLCPSSHRKARQPCRWSFQSGSCNPPDSRELIRPSGVIRPLAGRLAAASMSPPMPARRHSLRQMAFDRASSFSVVLQHVTLSKSRTSRQTSTRRKQSSGRCRIRSAPISRHPPGTASSSAVLTSAGDEDGDRGGRPKLAGGFRRSRMLGGGPTGCAMVDSIARQGAPTVEGARRVRPK